MVLENLNLEMTMRQLEAAGFYQVLLPFILIFTIIFAVLQKVQIFGPSSKNINIVIAILIAFFTIRAAPVITLINQFLPKVSAIVLVIMMLLLVLGIFGIHGDSWTGWPFFAAVLISIVAVGWSVFSSIPGLGSIPTWIRLSSTDKGILILVGIMLIIVSMFKEDNPQQKWGNWIKTELGPGPFGRSGPGGKP